MIVKDETAVIERCLTSVKPLIKYWVIVDTGSTDGTQELIRKIMADIPGELHERKWINFGHNRNEALQLAKDKGDYILIIDADETLVYDPSFKLPLLNKDFYYIETQLSGTKYGRTQLIKSSLAWQWKGVLHEALYSTEAKSKATIKGIANIPRNDGARSKDPDKFKKDARILEEALLKEPDNTRYAFYLAQSYRDAGDFEKALTAYENRLKMGGWNSEIFWSLLQIALLKEWLKRPPQEVIPAFKKAYLYQPSRAEPLYRLAQYQRSQENWKEAYEAAALGLTIKESKDLLFVESWIYDYGLLFEYSIAAYWIGLYTESKLSSEMLLKKNSLPANIRDRIEKNLVWINGKLDEQVRLTKQRFAEESQAALLP